MTDLIKPAGLFGKLWRAREVADLLYGAGWSDAVVNVEMGATVYSESGRYEAAVGSVNPNGSQDWGMFQLNNRHYTLFGFTDQASFYEACIDAHRSATMARQLFLSDRKLGGTGFGPWFGYGSDNYTAGIPASCGGLANAVSLRLIGKTVV